MPKIIKAKRAHRSKKIARTSLSNKCSLSELKFRRLFETAQDGILLINVKTSQIEEVNPFLEKLLGYSRKELLTKKIWDIGFLTDVLANKKSFKKLQRDKYIRYEDLPFETKGGSRIDVEFVSNLYTVGKKKIIQCNIRDVSRRVRKAAELKKDNDEINRLYQEAPCGYHSFDRDGVIIRINDTELKWLGYVRGEVVGKMNYSEMLSESGSKFFFESHLPQITTGGSVTNLEYELVRKDGSKMSVILNARAIRDAKGGFLMSNATVVDVTEQVNVTADLAKSELKYRTLVEAASDQIFMLDGQYRYLSVNKAFADAVDKKADQIIGRKIFDLFPQELATQFKKNVDLVFAEGKAITGIEEKAIKHGKEIDISSALNPAKDQQGRVTAVIGVVRDVTHRKKMEARDKELIQLKNKFIQIVSHQLRTPLSSIRWVLEEVLGKKVGDITLAQEEILRMAYDADKAVIVRIGDMLLAMDIEEGNLKLEKENATMEGLAASACREFTSRFELAKISHRHDVPEEHDTDVQVDPARILDVMRRLYENAVSYSKAGGEVVTKISQHDKVARFEISDKGIGIPKSELHHMFDKFYRGSNASAAKPDASGLGLYIVKSVIEAHGGTVGVTSEEGKGSTFWFEIPLK